MAAWFWPSRLRRWLPVASCAEPEDDLALLAGVQREGHLDLGARIQRDQMMYSLHESGFRVWLSVSGFRPRPRGPVLS
jgi:hypothetical protein